jgi:hypothetical protein
VFAKIFNTPNNGYADKFKHVIEPSVTLRRTTTIEAMGRIVELDSIDSAVGNATSVSYTLSNRVYAKRRLDKSTREIINVALTQSYYTDARSSQVDLAYRTSYSGTSPSHFSPLSLTARISPSDGLNGNLRADFDTQFMALRTIGADGIFSLSGWLQTTAGWSQRRFIEKLPGFNDPATREHYLNQSTTVRSPGGRVGGVYTFNYNFARQQFIQQRYVAYYNAQCCGIAFEYQKFNFNRVSTPGLKDNRFNFSFTLAGIGTFSNFFDAFGGAPGR